METTPTTYIALTTAVTPGKLCSSFTRVIRNEARDELSRPFGKKTRRCGVLDLCRESLGRRFYLVSLVLLFTPQEETLPSVERNVRR